MKPEVLILKMRNKMLRTFAISCVLKTVNKDTSKSNFNAGIALDSYFQIISSTGQDKAKKTPMSN